MRTLAEIFEDYAHYGSDAGHADKGSTHSYIEEYERLLAPYRQGCMFMEIGLALGWSLKMWQEYFHNSKLFGVDISVVFSVDEFMRRQINNNSVRIIQADATRNLFLRSVDGLEFDIIIDDGSHMENDQVETFQMLRYCMKKGGIYIIEDILALDQNRRRFEALHDNCEVIDLRHKKGRFDDVLICYKF